MNVAAWWLMALMMFEVTLGLFLVFAVKGLSWFRRAVGAVGSLGCLIIFLVLFAQLVSGDTADLPPIEPKLLIFLFVFVNIFGLEMGVRAGNFLNKGLRVRDAHRITAEGTQANDAEISIAEHDRICRAPFHIGKLLRVDEINFRFDRRVKTVFPRAQF